MVFLVLDDVDSLDEVLEAWQAIGVNGATIIDATGMHRRRKIHIPMRYAMGSYMVEEGNTALFSIVPDETVARHCLEVVEKIVGDLDQPNTGVFAAWPLAVVKGLPNLFRNS